MSSLRSENKNTGDSETLTFAVVISKTKADDGKTLTFAAGTQSSLVAAESAWFRKGAKWYGPHGKEYEFEQAWIGAQVHQQ